MGKTRENAAPGSGWRRIGRMLFLGLLALWMFGLGVLVGRGTAPVHFDLDEIERQLADLKRQLAAEEGERFKINLEKFNFFNTLKETEKGPVGPVPTIEAKFKKPPERLPVRPPVPEGQVSQSGEAGTESGVVSELFIQVASSKDAEATRRAVEGLKKAGYPAFSSRIEVPAKGIWYRIQLGPYTSQLLAEEDLSKLKKEHAEAYIIQR